MVMKVLPFDMDGTMFDTKVFPWMPCTRWLCLLAKPFSLFDFLFKIWGFLGTKELPQGYA